MYRDRLEIIDTKPLVLVQLSERGCDSSRPGKTRDDLSFDILIKYMVRWYLLLLAVYPICFVAKIPPPRQAR